MIKAVTSDEDIKITADLAHKIWNQHYIPIIGKKQVDYMVDKFQSVAAIEGQLKNGYSYFLIYFSGTPCGYMALVPEEKSKKLMISKIYVDSDLRGQNLGSELLNFALKFGQDNKFKTLWLTVNKNNFNSISWYEKRGFTKKEKVVMDIGNGFVMDDFIMQRDL